MGHQESRHTSAFPRHPHAPGLRNSRPSKTEGAGNAGRSMHPQPRVQIKKARKRSHHRFTGTIRHSLREWFYGLFHALPGDRAFCHRHRRDAKHHRRLDVSVETSEPRGFAVRFTRARQSRQSVHRIPLPTSVTIAIRPSCGGGTALILPLICTSGQRRLPAAHWHDGQITFIW
jgi:hypothetical protein